MLGGTGLLGQRAGAEFVARGHEVVSLARHPMPSDAPLLGVVEHRLIDAFAADEADMTRALHGCEALVYALGPDDRSEVRGDPTEFFRTNLVETTERTVRAACRAGVGKVVLTGSYFATWERMHPDYGFASRHPYVAARIEQSARAVAAGERFGASVSVLEIPYVFGTIRGEGKRWKELLFDRVRGPVVFFPTGGTSVITSVQAGQAMAGAVERGAHGARYPLNDIDLTWRELLSHGLEAMGRRPPIIGVPRWMAEFAARSMGRSLAARGLSSGLDPDHLIRDIMTQHMYVDATESREVLRYRPGGVPQAIRAVVREAYGLSRESGSGTLHPSRH